VVSESQTAILTIPIGMLLFLSSSTFITPSPLYTRILTYSLEFLRPVSPPSKMT
jgi:hypothetical protein